MFLSLTNSVSWVRESNMFLLEILHHHYYIEGQGECEGAFWIILVGMAQQALQIPHQPDGFFDAIRIPACPKAIRKKSFNLSRSAR